MHYLLLFEHMTGRYSEIVGIEGHVEEIILFAKVFSCASIDLPLPVHFEVLLPSCFR